ncbi:hypothetical protein [Nocardia sp. CC227C]|uniref:hypothetical protein n=1 Tax=Nocardia sp. CC227C TaxID=3044562 RepID=UPI00278C7615|nr:hypothetical protein [Nocardia sp. CC227C]
MMKESVDKQFTNLFAYTDRLSHTENPPRIEQLGFLKFAIECIVVSVSSGKLEIIEGARALAPLWESPLSQHHAELTAIAAYARSISTGGCDLAEMQYEWQELVSSFEHFTSWQEAEQLRR